MSSCCPLTGNVTNKDAAFNTFASKSGTICKLCVSDLVVSNTISVPGGGGGVNDLLLTNDIGTTVPVANEIITSGTGGNRTFGDNSNFFETQHLRSLTPFVAGDTFNTSEYQDLQTALNAAGTPAPLAGTFHVVILQPGIQYVGNIIVPNGVAMYGQLGAAIVGNVTIPAAATVFLFEANIQGGIAMAGQALIMYNSVVTASGALSAITITSGAFTTYNSSFMNSNLFNPTMLITGGSTIDINAALIQNTVPAGYGIRMLNTFLGPIFVRASRFPGGQQRFLQGSTIIGNYFDSPGNVALELDAATSSSIHFDSNSVLGTVSVLKDTSASDTTIHITDNTFRGASFSVTILSNPAPAVPLVPHVQIRNNILTQASVVTNFQNNTGPGLVLYVNNYIGGNTIAHSLTSGTFGGVLMIGNQIPAGSVIYTSIAAFMQHNAIENPVAAPLQIIDTSASSADFTILNNWLSTGAFGGGLPVISGIINTGTHVLRLMQNHLLTDAAPTDLFAVVVAGPASFVSDGQNDNVNGSANIATPPVVTIGTV